MVYLLGTKISNDLFVNYNGLQIGSGYSKKELQDFNAKLVDHWQPFDKRNPPVCIELASGFKEKPDAWIEPSKSAIVQVSLLVS